MSDTQQIVTTFQCRKVKPCETTFLNVDSATPEDAANIYHLMERGGVHLHGTDEWYAVIEVAGHGQYISKIHLDGIGRKGGVKPSKEPSVACDLAEVATLLDVPENDIAGDDWVGASSEWHSLAAI